MHEKFLAPLVREISWSNNIVIMEKCKDDLQREFYIYMTKRYGWTKRVLTNFVEGKTYEKYLLNQTNFDLTIPEERKIQAKLAVKDEYTFDFTELSPEYTEHELEIQLVNNVRKFLVEMGGDFTFIGNQYHLTVGIIICKSKDKTVVEYALKRSNVPIGVATYQLSSSLPESMRELLPTPEEIVRRLKVFEEE